MRQKKVVKNIAAYAKVWVNHKNTDFKIIYFNQAYLILVDKDAERKCENKAAWCEAAKPDCKTDAAKESCQKYCGICKGSN